MKLKKWVLGILLLCGCVSCTEQPSIDDPIEEPTEEPEEIDINDTILDTSFNVKKFSDVFLKNYNLEMDEDYRNEVINSKFSYEKPENGFIYSKCNTRYSGNYIEIDNYFKHDYEMDFSYIIYSSFNRTSSSSTLNKKRNKNFTTSQITVPEYDRDAFKMFIKRNIYDLNGDSAVLLSSNDFEHKIYANYDYCMYNYSFEKPLHDDGKFLFKDKFLFSGADGDYAIVYDSEQFMVEDKIYNFADFYQDYINYKNSNDPTLPSPELVGHIVPLNVYASIIYVHVEKGGIYLYSLNDFADFGDQVKYKGKILIDEFGYLYSDRHWKIYNKNY